MPSFFKTTWKKYFVYCLLVVLLIGTVSPATASNQDEGAGEDEVETELIKLDPSYQHDPFDGWGTALVWFANVIGGWPDEIKEELADALYGEEGLNFNIGRYNIGGGDSPETEPYMQKGGAVPGYWDRPDEFGPPEDAGDDWEEEENWWDPEDPDHWNWEADENQQWWIEAAKERGADIFEAFSNSPPYFMTQSGLVSGNFNSWDDNIKHDQFENFATYLTKVVDHLQDHLEVEFQTLSPVNEPNNGYWGAYGRQEGANWSPESQATIINEVKGQLDVKGLDTVVSAMDETNPSRFRHNWERYDQETKDNIGQLNVHTYWPEQRGSIRDIAKGEQTRLWMSEVDLGPSGIPQNHEDIRPALALSERIQTDIQELEPKAWVLWQAIEDEVNMNEDHENMNWGLIHVDFDPEDFDTLQYHKNKKYYAMGNYSKFIRPGYQFINTNNRETLAAIEGESDSLVIVYTNHSADEKTVQIDLSGFDSIDTNAVATPHVTSATDNLVEKESMSISDDQLSAVVQPESVTTFEISGVSGVNPEGSFLSEEQKYKFINKNSGKAMDIGSDGESIVQRTSANENDSQQWSIEKITDGYSHTEYYRIIHNETGKALGVDGWDAVLQDEVEHDDGQKWLLSTSGNGKYTLLNSQERVLLEVGGASESDDASIGLWNPNSGNNQVWQVVHAGIVDVESTNIVTFPGREPELPSEVMVTYGDGERMSKDVEWDAIDPSLYEEENTFDVNGTIEGTDTKAVANITVSEVSNIDPIKIKTIAGQEPELPELVQADLAIGSKGTIPVEWDEIDPENYAELGKFTVEGTIDGSDVTATAHVQVEEPGLENVALNQRGSDQEYPKAEASFTGQYDNVNHVNDGDFSSDRWTNWDPNNWREVDWVSIDFGQDETISQIDFTFYDDESGTRPPASLYLEYWDGNEWMEIPGSALEIPEDERTTEASIHFDPLDTSKVRSVMTAMEGPCIAIVEMEVYGISSSVPAIGTDATLESITVDGNEYAGFDPEHFDYTVELLAGTFDIPEIEVETNHIFASYDIELPETILDEVVITVTAEDEVTTNIYHLEFEWIPRRDWNNRPFPHPVHPKAKQ